MKPKIRRAKLFRDGHTLIRTYVEEDFNWLCVAYEKESGQPPCDSWMDNLTESLRHYDLFWMIEDNNPQFKKGDGPVGFVYAKYNDWKLEPHVQWFKWATFKNKLRGTVDFFMSVRKDRFIGCIEVRCSEEDEKWFRKLSRTWIPMFPVGGKERNFVPAGRPDGREWVWYMRGKAGYGRNRQPVQEQSEVNATDNAGQATVPADPN